MTLAITTTFTLAENSLVPLTIVHAEETADDSQAFSFKDSLIVTKSPYSVKTTGKRLELVLMERGFTIFNRIDHAAGANSVGEQLRPTQVIIFGNPRVGTLLMQCQQSVAIDLPQKALIWQNEQGQVQLAYNNPQYLVARHQISGCDQVVENIEKALAAIVKETVER
ncbi:MAG: DUF302 domain-containing protein [Symploca sp. SIO3C6]|uniref:DUF302 domain-containing protein n=1 Tax=Symploca sp. SIO1C4 TaxID=2607765 RepID=A0A6B3NL37_9CYAN|nr:DUF302 domain-containing protein [Symploca sp. SIO3C6]NER29958.1 DUF302 domain-containing protein [Symploca sp. SIO1C4]NET05840.1 DUF302 domain-containing protein [Symploca sp. SIO2B6]NET51481.1 DUF302 domain-containing protein [Merismopedia sp. SIO2A8]